ncbi:MAG: tetratricopeptide repeat protein [candidate division Zixibacteria bacterium]|nr:tetratricopeptide repeat protein [candidate division Zixibacteria bacterium]
MTEYILVFLLLLVVATGFYLVYERLTGKKKDSPHSSYVEALRDLLDGRQESAFTKLRQVVAEDSQNLDAYLRLGQILRENSQAERAIQVHKDLTLRQGLPREDKVAILHQLSLDYLALNDVKMAESALRELIGLAGDDHWAHTRLLKLLEKSQRWEDAYDTAVRILQLEANKSKKPLARFKYQAGLQLYRKREYHKARIVFKEAIGLDPTYVDAYLAIGDSYADEGRHEDAVTFWNKLISAVPEQGHRVIDRLQKTLFDLGRFGDIQGICESILEHAPRNIEARRALAEFYAKKGDLDQAVEIIESIFDDYPVDQDAALKLIRLYLERGEQDRIRGLLRNIEQRREKQRELPADRASSAVSPEATA